MKTHSSLNLSKSLRPLRLFAVASVLASGPLGLAQTAPQSVLVAETAIPKLNAEELSQLLAPIALYPDALIAVILPASTVPSDIVLGARFIQQNPSEALIESQPWDDSVKSLSRYPEVLTWMDENLQWTAAVGEAFVEQPADVMNVIQGLREQARAAGNLKDTPEQKVVVVEEVIRIVPADPEIIYVPQYDPQVVYVQSYDPAPLLTFGVGFAVGAWLNYDFDWNQRCLYRGNWRGWNNNNWNSGWGNQGGWGGWGGGGNNNINNNSNVNVVNIDVTNVNEWQPSNSAIRQTNQRQRNNNGNARYVSNKSNRNDLQDEARNDRNNRGDRVGRFNPELESNLPRPARLERQDRKLERTAERANRRNNGREITSDDALPIDEESTRIPNRADRPGNESPGSTPPTTIDGRERRSDRTPSDTPLRNEDRNPEDRNAQQPNAEQPRSRPSAQPAEPAPRVNEDRQRERQQARQERRDSLPGDAETPRNPNRADRSEIQTPGSTPPAAAEERATSTSRNPSKAPKRSEARDTENRSTQRPNAQQPGSRPLVRPTQPAPQVNQEDRQQARQERRDAKPQRQQAQPQRQQAQPQRQQAQPQRQQAQPQRQQRQERSENRPKQQKQERRAEAPKQQKQKEASRPAKAEKQDKKAAKQEEDKKKKG